MRATRPAIAAALLVITSLTCLTGPLAVTPAAADPADGEPEGVAVVTPADGATVPYRRAGIQITVDLTDVYLDDEHMLAVECQNGGWDDLQVFYFDNTGTTKMFTEYLQDPYPGASCLMYGLIPDRTFTVGYPPQEVDAFRWDGTKEFWPLPDGYQDTITFGYSLEAPADVTATVKHGRQVVRTADLGPRPARISKWEWNGRTNTGSIAPAGSYTVAFTATDPGTGQTATSESVDFAVRNGDDADVLTVSDRAGDTSRAIDVRRLRVAYHPRTLELGASIPNLAKAEIWGVYAMIDSGRRDGAVYLVNARNRNGRLTPKMTTDQIGDAAPGPRKVRCPGLRLRLGAGDGISRGMELRVPEGCLPGHDARVNFAVFKRNRSGLVNEADYTPDGGRYWTPWVGQPF